MTSCSKNSCPRQCHGNSKRCNPTNPVFWEQTCPIHKKVKTLSHKCGPTGNHRQEPPVYCPDVERTALENPTEPAMHGCASTAEDHQLLSKLLKERVHDTFGNEGKSTVYVSKLSTCEHHLHRLASSETQCCLPFWVYMVPSHAHLK